jgi:hypothetical protein
MYDAESCARATGLRVCMAQDFFAIFSICWLGLVWVFMQ